MENNNITGLRVLSDDAALRVFCEEQGYDKSFFYDGETLPDDCQDRTFERLKEDEYGNNDAIIKHVKEG